MAIWQKWLRRDRDGIPALYEALSHQARQPAFFTDFGVADTPEGRYGVIVLHMFLAMERLASASAADDREGGGKAREEARRRLVEAFIDDMDQAFREMGVGDLGVPAKVKRAAAGLLETVDALTGAIRKPAASDLDAVLQSVLPSAPGRRVDVARIAAYLRASKAEFAIQDLGAILSGTVRFAALDGTNHRDRTGA